MRDRSAYISAGAKSVHLWTQSTVHFMELSLPCALQHLVGIGCAHARLTYTPCRSYAKGFGAVGALYAGSECVIEKVPNILLIHACQMLSHVIVMRDNLQKFFEFASTEAPVPHSG